MEVTSHHSVAVVESSQTAGARIDARELSERAGLDETDAYRVGLVATELSTNLVKHAAQGGELLMRITTAAPDVEIELLSIDRGPGIRDIARSLSDGHSTAGSPGTGLGAIRRLADDFDIYSQLGRGTVVMARLRARRVARLARVGMNIAVVSVPKPGESLCGDAWSIRQYMDGATILMTDGLGHGVQAAEASDAAVQAFSREPIGDVTRALKHIHQALYHTRGAAGAIAEIRTDRRVLRYIGVGNIAAAVCTDGAIRQAVSHNGTLGHQAQSFHEYTYPWSTESIFVMHSDGLSARWTLDPYPGLASHDPAVVAAVLYRDFSRSRDDATVLVGQEAA